MRYLTLVALAALALPRVALADSADAISQNAINTTDGKVIYQTLCQGCHMADAKGATGAAHFPSLSGNPKLATGGYLPYIVANGYGGMPWFADKLSDAQIASLANYVRTHFGNNYSDVVTPAMVAKVRPTPDATRATFD